MYPFNSMLKAILIGTLAAALLFTAVHSFRQSDKATSIVLAESSFSVPAALSFIARHEGFWEKRGLDVKVTSFTAGRLSLDALLGGAAQFATAAQTPLAIAPFSHSNYSIIAMLSTSPNELGVIARRSAGISSPTDLRGKRIAYFAGTQSDYFMNLYLEKHGLSTRDVTAISMPPPDSVSAIRNGDVDAVVAWRPNSLKALAALGDDGISLPVDGLYTGILSFVASKEFTEDHPAVVKNVLLGLIDAEAFAKEHPDRALDIVAKQVKIEPEFLRTYFSEYDLRVQLTDELISALESEGRWAIRTGVAASGSSLPDYRKWIDPVFLEAARSVISD